MDYLPFQRLFQSIDAAAAEWESLRGAIESVVAHRQSGEHKAADRLLAFDLPRLLAPLADRYSEAECQRRVAALFEDAYQLSALRRTIGEAPGAGAASRPPALESSGADRAAPAAAESAPVRPRRPAPKRSFQEPDQNDIASMIDDMLSGSVR